MPTPGRWDLWITNYAEATAGRLGKTWVFWVWAVEWRRFPAGVSPTRQPSVPEATGAVMQVSRPRTYIVANAAVHIRWRVRVIFSRRAPSPLTAAYPQIASVPVGCRLRRSGP